MDFYFNFINYCKDRILSICLKQAIMDFKLLMRLISGLPKVQVRISMDNRNKKFE